MPARSIAPGALAAALLLFAAPALAAEETLNPFPDWFTMLPVLIVLFAILIWPTHKIVFQPLLRVLDERHARIEGARNRADQVAKEAASVLAHYEATVSAAKDEAELERRAQMDVARTEQAKTSTQARAAAEQHVTAARAEVARSLEDARAQLRTEAEPLAVEAASRVLGRPIS